jgi:hypothetical protein
MCLAPETAVTFNLMSGSCVFGGRGLYNENIVISSRELMASPIRWLTDRLGCAVRWLVEQLLESLTLRPVNCLTILRLECLWSACKQNMATRDTVFACYWLAGRSRTPTAVRTMSVHCNTTALTGYCIEYGGNSRLTVNYALYSSCYLFLVPLFSLRTHSE